MYRLLRGLDGDLCLVAEFSYGVVRAVFPPARFRHVSGLVPVSRRSLVAHRIAGDSHPSRSACLRGLIGA